MGSEEDVPSGHEPPKYRHLFALTPWRRLVAATTGARIPVAMAPLAFVYIGHAATGSFAVGSVMAGAYSVAEAICSPVSGRVLDRLRDIRRGLILVLIAGALCMIALSIAGWLEAPTLVLVSLAAACGGIPAGAQGGLRAVLQRIVPSRLRERAFALDATILELQWAIAPAIVAVCIALEVPLLTAAAMALAAVIGAAVVAALPATGDQTATETPTTLRIPAWRAPSVLGTYAASLMLGYAEGTVTVALPALLDELQAPGAYAGLILVGLSLASAAGGWLYGLLTPRLGAPSPLRASILLVIVGVLVIPVGLSPVVSGIAVAAMVLGMFIAPTNAVRSLLLGRLLPEKQHAEGFSMLYGINVLGFGISGIASAMILPTGGAIAVFVVAGSVTALTGIGAIVLNRLNNSN